MPSLEMSMDLLSTVGQCDNGYACVYQNNLSWSSPTTPLPSEAHPRIVFERLFGEGGSAADRRAALEEAGQPARLGDRGDRPAEEPARPGGSRPGRPVPGYRPRGRAPDPEGRGRREGQRPAGPRPARGRAGLLRRPRPADVRPPGAGAPGGRHPRHHVPARPRDQRADLSRDRRPRPAPPAHAPRERPRQDRQDGQDQPVPRLALRRVPREAEGHAGGERLAAGPLALPLRQRDGQPEPPRPHEPADPRRRAARPAR